uniref:acid phosphatase n=1 Tax=Meloidogyne incognita TaxID=6306 RepID=A0A914M1B0_MELIC
MSLHPRTKVTPPVAKNADEQIFESEEFREIEQANRPFLQYIANNSGLFNLTLRNIYKINDPLTFIFAHQNDGFKLPNWVTETIRKEITRLYNLKNSFDFKTEKQKRLLSGLLFTEILNRMENIACLNEFGSKEKFYAYSGHDGNVAGLLAIFGINLEIFPKFSTALLIELHKQKNKSEGLEENTSTFFIRLFYKNETDGNGLLEIEIPDCGNICSLGKLKEIRREYIIELKEWNNECKNNSDFIDKVNNMTN